MGASNRVENSHEGVADIVEIAAACWRSRRVVAVAATVIGAAFTVYAWLAPPTYSATAVLAPATQERQGLAGRLSALSQLGGIASLAGIDLQGADSETEEALAILQSRGFIYSFIRDYNLLPVLFADKWDSDAGKWRGLSANQPTLAEGYQLFVKRLLRVQRDKRSGLVSLSVEWRDRGEAVRWVNALAERVNEFMRKRTLERAAASEVYLERELKQTSEIGMREAINRLIEEQARQRMLATVNKEYTFRIVDMALPLDAREYVRPRRWLLTCIGWLSGFVFGILLALGVNRRGGGTELGPSPER